MDAFQQRQRLFNSQRETYSLLKPDAPKPMPFMSKMLSTLNLFCLTQCPQDGCLYERWSQCEASSFKAKYPRNGCLSAKTFLILSVKLRETYFLLKPDAPKTNAFHVKHVVNIEPFLFDTMPPRWKPLWKMVSMWSQLFKSNMPPKWMPFSKDFLILSVKPILCWNLMPQNQCLSCQRCCQHWTFFVWHNAPKWMPLWKMVSMWSQFF